MQKEITDPVLEYTSPEDRGKCGFCSRQEDGYAKRDESGKFRASCWPDINKTRTLSEPLKRKSVGTVVHEDLDAEDRIITDKKKSPGMAPSTHRPTVR